MAAWTQCYGSNFVRRLGEGVAQGSASEAGAVIGEQRVARLERRLELRGVRINPEGIPSAPLLEGSGKLGTPWVCMQWANASSAELFDPPPPLFVPDPPDSDPPGKRCSQAWVADWKFGLL